MASKKPTALMDALDAAQPQSVQRSKTSLAEKALPIGPEYYNLKTDDNLVAPKGRIVPFILFLRIMQAGIFLAMILYYSLPFSFKEDDLISYEWDYNNGTHTCTPMFPDSYWSDTQTYARCMKEVKPPLSSETIRDGSLPNQAGVSVPYKYYTPFPSTTNIGAGIGGAFEAGGLFKTKADATVAQNAFAEYLRTIDACGHDGGFSQLASEDEWRIELGQIPYWKPNASVNLSSFPYSLPHENVCETYTQNDHFSYCNAKACKRSDPNVDFLNDCLGRDPGTRPRYEPWEAYCTLYEPTDMLDLFSPFSCYFNHSWPKLQNLLGFFGVQDQYEFKNYSAFAETILAMYDRGLANAFKDAAKLAGVNGDLYDLLAKTYRRDADFATCDVTPQLARKYFEAWYSEYVCAHTKSNAPYRCEAKLPTPPLEMLSLAYSNSLLFYTVLSAVCVAYFFRDVERK